MANDKPSEIVRVLEGLFVHRRDTFGIQQSDGSYIRQNKPITVEVLEEHLAGNETVGVYQADNGTVKWIVGDFDGDDDPSLHACVTAFRRAALNRGVPPSAMLIEDSGRRGYHLWIFFAAPAPLAVAHNFGMELARAAKVPSTTGGHVHLEIFPKQSQIPPDGFGNLVKLPLGIHRKSGRRGFLVEPNTFESVKEEALKGVKPWMPPRELVERLSKLIEYPKPSTDEPLLAEGDFPCWTKLSKGQVPEGSRHDAALALAGHLRDQKLSMDAVEAVMRRWWGRLPQPPATAAPRPWEDIRRTIVDAYKRGYRVGCKTIREKWPELCDPNCPLRKEPTESEQAYFDDGRFVPKWLAEDIMKEYNFAAMDGDVIYVCVNGVYVPSGEAIIKCEAQSRLGDRATTHYVDEVVGFIKRETYQPREKFNPKHLINLKNGFLNIETGELLPLTPEKLSTIRIPVAYVPSANCPNIQKFLLEVLHEDDMPTILELFGYCLYLGYPIHKAFMFVGEGANGKSTLINLLKTFLMRENCASVSLQELEINRFATNALDGKLANLYADLPSKALSSTARFKMLTGEDLIGAERKFGAHFTFENHAKLIFSTNRIPKAEDDTVAFFRRWIIVNFPNVFEGKRADKRILEKLTTDEELSGLLNLALKGLRDLLERGDFSSGKSTEEAREQYIRMSDSIGAFMMDRVEIAPDEWVGKRELYSVYCEYCRDNNYPTVSDGTFHKNIHQHVKIEDYRPRMDGKRVSAWRGIRIREGGSREGAPKVEKIEEAVNHVKDVNPFPYSLFTFDSGKENREEKKESRKEVEKTPDIPDTKEPEIEPIVDTACSRCRARGEGLHWTRAGEPLCDKCAEDYPGDL